MEDNSHNIGNYILILSEQLPTQNVSFPTHHEHETHDLEGVQRLPPDPIQVWFPFKSILTTVNLCV